MPNPKPPRAPRPPAPDLRMLDTLDRTHHDIVEMLARLHLLVEKIGVRGTDGGICRAARDICDFFDGTAHAHHATEEKEVFPDLLALGDPELEHAVRRLQQDHGWLEEDWLELAPHLRAVANGQAWFDLEVLRAGVPVFAELYRDHIALEETIVYPASRRRREAAAAAARARTHA